MAAAGSGDLADVAPAKVNLTLHVLGRRADGYHEIESLVAFADIGDRLTFAPGETLALDLSGPTAQAAGAGADNLVRKAARALAERVEGLRLGRFSLDKQLPVAAGLGGGSSDAAATLRLLARVNDLSLDDERVRAAAQATGADVPVCLDPKARMMRGIGEILSDPFALPELPAVLVNPGVAVPTKDVFAALAAPPLTTPAQAEDFFQINTDAAALVSILAARRNDLEIPAIKLQAVIADVLEALQASPNCLLARMSGSGATCFGLFGSAGVAQEVAQRLQAEHPGWWVRAT
ncbi:MAG TPA: 4-(cytidine 5'-diphospho)-2-C-methyl-D-erythritol kinase, partial [Xanthobacteraceae bacterium]|nr:4-(cytidine 5'-diphospho)-2-C-methyl-D-erythritol kinase [Xanthobacteraceae bacterium]